MIAIPQFCGHKYVLTRDPSGKSCLQRLANFALIYIMTAGGTDNSTDILTVYSYQQGFVFKKLGYGALLGDVLVIISTVFAYLYVRAARQRPVRTRLADGV